MPSSAFSLATAVLYPQHCCQFALAKAAPRQSYIWHFPAKAGCVIATRYLVGLLHSVKLQRLPRILFVQATEAAALPPVINAAVLLAESGWKVTVLTAPIAGETCPFRTIRASKSTRCLPDNHT